MNCFKYHIKNSWIVTGDGSEPVKQELLISVDGRILAVGDSFTGCGKVLNGEGLLLVPGFIDAHGHSDLSGLAYPDGFSKISQGITTEIAGNCGLSAFPLTDENRKHLEELYANYNVPLAWNDYNSFRDFQKKKGTVPDVIPLCGHNTLRAAAAGYEKQTLTSAQLDQMCKQLAAALEAGSPGLSTGLLYVPGKFASDGELLELMRVLQRKQKIFTTHLRSEGDGLLESLSDTLDLARSAGLKKVQISHFKTAGAANWHKLDTAIELIMQARREGINVTVDRYPYTESMTQLSIVLPGEWSDLDDVSIGRKLQNPEERRQLAAQLDASKTEEDWKRIRLASTGADKYRKYCGMLFPDISNRPAELVVDLLAEDAVSTCGAFSGMSEENLRRIMRLDFCMPGSDGNILPSDYSAGRAHPRSFGTVPGFLKLLFEDNVSIGSAIRRATGLPAETFGLYDRGIIAAGRRADLVLIDPEELADTANFSSPHSPAKGIKFTMIGGELIYCS